VSFRAFRAPPAPFSAFPFSTFSFSFTLPVHDTVHECPCPGAWNMFHSPQTLALALDTDPGVVPNQKQGAKRGLRQIMLRTVSTV
jgi:hypothetical protein